jgi:hypothetical protein
LKINKRKLRFLKNKSKLCFSDGLPQVILIKLRFENQQKKTSLPKKQKQALFLACFIFNFLLIYA